MDTGLWQIIKKLRYCRQFKYLSLNIICGFLFFIAIAIEFGNWLDAACNFLPKTAVCELTKPYRSNTKQLLSLWDNIRKMEDDVLDKLQGGEFSANFDPSIFTSAEEYDLEDFCCFE